MILLGFEKWNWRAREGERELVGVAEGGGWASKGGGWCLNWAVELVGRVGVAAFVV